MPDGVAALGRIDNERLMSFAMSAADVFVLPTRAEAFGLVILEALACGTPIVSFDVGGVTDLVRPGETGLLAPPEDVTALREAILRLVGDEALHCAMSAACRALAETHSLEAQAARYLAIYDELCRMSTTTPATGAPR